ncbi:hypothetical protein WA158_003635 [Blastocystis sp. Blastoise]
MSQTNTSILFNTMMVGAQNKADQITGFPKTLGIDKYETCLLCYHAFCDVKCSLCNHVFHKGCISDEPEDSENWICANCKKENNVCELCGEISNNSTYKCSRCNGYYHKKCLEDYRYEIEDEEADFICPKHFCYTCNTQDNEDTLVTCIHCRRSFHRTCLPDYTISISPYFVLCTHHPGKDVIGHEWKFQDLMDQITRAKKKLKKVKSLKPSETTPEKPSKPIPQSIPAVIPTSITPGYVFCERCKQWRVLPNGFTNDALLSSKWFCEYNTWNELCSNCQVIAENEGEGTEALNRDPPVWLMDYEGTNPKTLPYKMNQKQLLWALYYAKNIDENLIKINYSSTYSISSLYNNYKKQVKRCIDSPYVENTKENNILLKLKEYFSSVSSFTIHDISIHSSLTELFPQTKYIKSQIFIYIHKQILNNKIKIKDNSNILSEETALVFIYDPCVDALPLKMKKTWKQYTTPKE